MIALAVASLLVIFAGLVGGRSGALAMMLAALTFPVLLLVALLKTGRRLRVVVGTFAALLLVVGCAIYRGVGRETVALGLPVTAWLMLVGLILGPLVVVGLGHAWSFDEVGREEGERGARAE
jgi:hypothetical protein